MNLRTPFWPEKADWNFTKIDISGGRFPAKKWLAFVGNWS